MTPAITRLFDRYEDAADAVRELEAAGIPHDDISLIANNADGRTLDAADDGDRLADPHAGGGAAKGATTGGILGGGAGLLAGLGMLAIPGLGPVVAAGWLASTALGAAVGAVAGGVTGGLLGALKDAGHSDADAHVYAEGVRRGGALVSVRAANETDTMTVERVLNGRGGVDAATRGADYRSAGWERFDETAEPYNTDQIAADRRQRIGEDRSFMGQTQDGMSQSQGGMSQSSGVAQSDDLREEPVRDGGFGDPANRANDPGGRGL